MTLQIALSFVFIYDGAEGLSISKQSDSVYMVEEVTDLSNGWILPGQFRSQLGFAFIGVITVLILINTAISLRFSFLRIGNHVRRFDVFKAKKFQKF